MADHAAAVAAAAAIAARLSQSLPGASAPAAQSTSYADPSTITDPVERAKAIAAKLSGTIGSSLGKRSADQISGGGFAISSGDDHKIKRKIFVPTHDPEMNYLGLLIGPKGSTQKRLEQESGARIFLRGRGANKDGGGNPKPEDFEELHVLIVADSDQSADKAEALVKDILFNTENAKRIKNEQLRGLANGNTNDGMGMGGMGGGPGRGHRQGMGMGGGMSGGGRPGERPGDTSIRFGIPSSLAGGVLGRGGENIKTVQNDTGVHVQIQAQHDMAPGAVERVVTVSGAPGAVEAARLRIMQLVEERRTMGGAPGGMGGGMGGQSGGYGPGGGGGGGGGFTTTVQIPDDKAGSVIGRQGSTIKTIQARTGANIQVPKEADRENPSVRSVTITAPTQQSCEAAAQEIYAILSQPDRGRGGGGMGGGGGGGGAGGGYGSSSTVVTIPNEKAGQVIGTKGMVIRELEGSTGCRIQIPTAADPGSVPPVRSVVITGPPHALEDAKQRILAIISSGPGGGGGAGGGGYAATMAGYGAYGPAAAMNPYGAYGATAGYGAMAQQQAAYGGYGAAAAQAGYAGYGAMMGGYAAQAGGAAADPYAAYYAQMAMAAQGQGAAAAVPAAAAAAVDASGPSAGTGTAAGGDADAQAKAWEEYYKQLAAYNAAQAAAGGAAGDAQAAAAPAPANAPSEEDAPPG